jgi:hypothetical protein
MLSDLFYQEGDLDNLTEENHKENDPKVPNKVNTMLHFPVFFRKSLVFRAVKNLQGQDKNVVSSV